MLEFEKNGHRKQMIQISQYNIEYLNMKISKEIEYKSKPFSFTKSSKHFPKCHSIERFEEVIQTKKVYQTMIKDQLRKLDELQNAQEPLIQPFYVLKKQRFQDDEESLGESSELEIRIQRLKKANKKRKCEMIFTKMKMLKEYNKKCRAAEYYRYEYMITKVFKYWKHQVQGEQENKDKIQMVKRIRSKNNLIKLVKLGKRKDSKRIKIFTQMHKYRKIKEVLKYIRNIKQLKRQRTECQIHLLSSLIGNRFKEMHQNYSRIKKEKSKLRILANIKKHRNIKQFLEISIKRHTKQKIMKNIQNINNQNVIVEVGVFSEYSSDPNQQLFQQKRILLRKYLQDSKKLQLIKLLSLKHKSICLQYREMIKKVKSFYLVLRIEGELKVKTKTIKKIKQQYVKHQMQLYNEFQTKLQKIGRKKNKYNKIMKNQNIRLVFHDMRSRCVYMKKITFTQQVVSKLHHQNTLKHIFKILKEYHHQPQLQTSLSDLSGDYSKQTQQLTHLLQSNTLKMWKSHFDMQKKYTQMFQQKEQQVKRVFLKKLKIDKEKKNKEHFVEGQELIRQIRSMDMKRDIIKGLVEVQKINRLAKRIKNREGREFVKELSKYSIVNGHRNQLTSLKNTNKVKEVFVIFKQKCKFEKQCRKRVQKLRAYRVQGEGKELLELIRYNGEYNRDRQQLVVNLNRSRCIGWLCGLRQYKVVSQQNTNIQFYHHQLKQIIKISKFKQLVLKMKAKVQWTKQKQKQKQIQRQTIQRQMQKQKQQSARQEQEQGTVKEQLRYVQGIQNNAQPLFNTSQKKHRLQQSQESPNALDKYLQQGQQSNIVQSYQQFKAKLNNKQDKNREQSFQQSYISVTNQANISDSSHNRSISYEQSQQKSHQHQHQQPSQQSSQSSILEYQLCIQKIQKKLSICKIKTIIQGQERERKLKEKLLSCRFSEFVDRMQTDINNKKHREDSDSLVQYQRNKHNNRLVQAVFMELKDMTSQNKVQSYQTKKKVFEGLRMYSKQKALLKKYLGEYQELSYYPKSISQLHKFKQIANQHY